jgi:(4S)-4-hydroxy-5-phosphonooxypentane-2,3-dione isomerase
MIVRIVKMEFQQKEIKSFIEMFNSIQDKIVNFDGCMGVELLNSVDSDAVYFTYSTWKSQRHLENYRNSKLFKETWAKTRKMFSNKAEAWSLVKNQNSKL